MPCLPNEISAVVGRGFSLSFASHTAPKSLRDSDGDGKLDERLYALSDANRNIVSLYDVPLPGSQGEPKRIVERMEYSPYGVPSFWDKDFSEPLPTSAHDWNILYGGYYYDTETGLYLVRNRVYHPHLGRWLQVDPLGFQDSFNPYQYCQSAPGTFVDPTGQLVGLLLFGALVIFAGYAVSVGLRHGPPKTVWEGLVPIWGSGRHAGAYFAEG